MRSSTVSYMLTAAGLASATTRGLPFMVKDKNGSEIPFPLPNNTIPLLPNNTVPLLPNGTFPNGTFPNITLPFPNNTLPLLPNATYPNVTLPLPNNTLPLPPNDTFPNATNPLPNGTRADPRVSVNLTHPPSNETVTYPQYNFCMLERASAADKCPRPAWHLSTDNKRHCARHPAAGYKCVSEEWVELLECQRYMWQGGPLCVLEQFLPTYFYRWANKRDGKYGGRAFRACMSHRATVEEACQLPRSLLRERTHRCYVYDVPGRPLPEGTGCWGEEMLEYQLCVFYRGKGGAKDCLVLWPGNDTAAAAGAGALATSPVEPDLDALFGL